MKIIEGSEYSGVCFEVELDVNDKSKQARVRCGALGIEVYAGTPRQAIVRFANALKMLNNKKIMKALK